MFYLATFLVFIPSPIIFVISSEAWAVVVGLSGERPWYLVGPVLGAAQTVTFVLLYFFGGKLVTRMPRLRAKLDSFDTEKLRAQAPLWLSIGALTGVPPLVVMTTAAPMVGVQFAVMFTCSLVGRMVRFSVLAGVPHYFSRWADVDLLPTWMVQLIASG